MSAINVNVSRKIFNAVYLPYLNDHTRIQIFYGGSSSGKSRFVAQRCVYDMLAGGRNYLIARSIARTVRRSVFNELQKIITEWGVGRFFDTNKSEGIITCVNGYQILFSGLDDVEKVKSITPAKGVITDVWVEEATEADAGDIKQLLKRQRGGSAKTKKRLTLTFNPILELHWIYKTYFSPIGWASVQTTHHDENISILKTTYKDNRFLTPDDIRGLENETDEYFYNVYTLGNWGVLGDVIFKNWRVEDLSEMRAAGEFVNHRHGGDFGYSSDPAAIVATHYDRKHKAIYIYDELYERGMTNDVLATETRRMIGGDVIYWDSSEPKSIAELRQHGINAQSAMKGRDSIYFGIQWLRQHEIIVGKHCINTRNELQQYQWRKNRHGESLNQPVDKNNHLIDALRYAYSSDMRGGGQIKIRDYT